MIVALIVGRVATETQVRTSPDGKRSASCAARVVFPGGREGLVRAVAFNLIDRMIALKMGDEVVLAGELAPAPEPCVEAGRHCALELRVNRVLNLREVAADTLSAAATRASARAR